MLSVILTAFQFSMKIQKTVLLYGFRKTKKEKVANTSKIEIDRPHKSLFE